MLARSDPIPDRAAATCHAVRLLAPPLAPGGYRLWVLHGGEVLAAAPFTAQPNPDEPLLAESFDDPARATLPADSPDPARFALGCRTPSPALDSGYRVSFGLERGAFLLDRWDAGAVTSLAQGRAPPFRGGGQSNRLELTCAEGTIAVAVNGTEVARVQDGVHRAGLFWIGVEPDPGRRHGVDVRFDNLMVTQR